MITQSITGKPINYRDPANLPMAQPITRRVVSFPYRLPFAPLGVIVSALASNLRTDISLLPIGGPNGTKGGKMTAVGIDLHENALAGLIGQGVPVVVLSPHLDDAVRSCGALMTYALSRTSVTVVTFFTEPGQAPYTRSARRYLRQAGGRDADAVFQHRRDQE